jgi:hypothetical protein
MKIIFSYYLWEQIELIVMMILRNIFNSGDVSYKTASVV